MNTPESTLRHRIAAFVTLASMLVPAGIAVGDEGAESVQVGTDLFKDVRERADPTCQLVVWRYHTRIRGLGIFPKPHGNGIEHDFIIVLPLGFGIHINEIAFTFFAGL